MNFKVYDKRGINGVKTFNNVNDFNEYHQIVWSCDHELVYLGLDVNNFMVFERKEN